MIGAKFANLGRGGFGEDRGGFGWGEVKARLGGGKCRGELGVVFAEVVCREEEVVEVGFGEPIAECRPNAAFCKCGYEAEFGECAWRRIEGDELEDGADIRSRFGVATNRVFLPFGRWVGGRLEVEELPTGLKVRKSLGVHDYAAWRIENGWRVLKLSVDELCV